MVLPLQLQLVPEVILIEVDSNYFLLTAEIKFETRECPLEGVIVGVRTTLVLSQIETAFKLKNIDRSGFENKFSSLYW